MKNSISAIIPAYNAEKYLAEAIESILNQTVKPDEILVTVDDGSIDNTAEVAKRFASRVTVISQKHCTISKARNSAIQRCEGSILAFLDADDYWTTDHIEKLYPPMQLNGDLDMVSGFVEQFISSDMVEGKGRTIPEGQQVMPGYLPGSSLIKKSAFEKAGLYDENLTLAGEVDWFARAQDAGISDQLIDDVVLKRRIHSDNLSLREKDHMKDYAKVLLASIRRKRMKSGE